MATGPLRATRIGYLDRDEWESERYTVRVQLTREMTPWERRVFGRVTARLPGESASIGGNQVILASTTVEEVRAGVSTIQAILNWAEQSGGEQEARANAEMKRRNDLAQEGF